MKLTRLILVCTLLLLAASPTFAAPPCSSCIEEGAGPCVADPGSGTRCKTWTAACETLGAYCINFIDDSSVLADWTVASIEINRPAQDSTIVTTPTAVAEIQTVEPASQK